MTEAGSKDKCGNARWLQDDPFCLPELCYPLEELFFALVRVDPLFIFFTMSSAHGKEKAQGWERQEEEPEPGSPHALWQLRGSGIAPQ